MRSPVASADLADLPVLKVLARARAGAEALDVAEHRLRVGEAAEVADLFAPNKKDKSELKKAAKDGKISQDDVIELWSDKLGPETTEKDLEGFARKSEKIALKRYGKDWNYNEPKGEEQKNFANMIRKGEEEIVKRMKK